MLPVDTSRKFKNSSVTGLKDTGGYPDYAFLSGPPMLLAAAECYGEQVSEELQACQHCTLINVSKSTAQAALLNAFEIASNTAGNTFTFVFLYIS